MDLLKDALLWISAALLYLMIGYQIGKISLEVYRDWEQVADGDALGKWATLRFALFPMSTLEKVENGSHTKHLVIAAAVAGGKENTYLALHMFLWPLRIAWSVVMLAIIFGSSMLSLPVALAWRMLRDPVVAMVRFFKKPASNPQTYGSS